MARAAIKEWNETLTCLNGKIIEETNCSEKADISLRWEDEDFFKDWPNGPDLERRGTIGRWHGPKGGDPNDSGLKVIPEKDFPQNEIYLNAKKSWFVDPTPEDDSEFDKKDCYWKMKEANKNDLYTIIKHEFGHALGLHHSDPICDVMTSEPSLDGENRGLRQRLTVDDEARLQNLYCNATYPPPDKRIPKYKHTPSSDSWINQMDPDTCYGNSSTLSLVGDTGLVYLKFNLSLIPTGAHITSAQIYIYFYNGSVTVGNVSACEVSDAWDEKTVTWNNAPIPTAVIGTMPIGDYDWYIWDITSYATREYLGDRMLSVVLNMSEPFHKDFWSWEGGGQDKKTETFEIGGSPYIQVEYTLQIIGGSVISVDKLALLAPWIFLAVSVAVAAVSVAVYRKKYGGF